MRFKTTFKISTIALASTVAIAGLISQTNYASVESSGLGQDFLMLQQVTVDSFQHPLTVNDKLENAQTLVDWEFTKRERKPKCRFVD